MYTNASSRHIDMNRRNGYFFGKVQETKENRTNYVNFATKKRKKRKNKQELKDICVLLREIFFKTKIFDSVLLWLYGNVRFVKAVRVHSPATHPLPPHRLPGCSRNCVGPRGTSTEPTSHSFVAKSLGFTRASSLHGFTLFGCSFPPGLRPGKRRTNPVQLIAMRCHLPVSHFCMPGLATRTHFLQKNPSSGGQVPLSLTGARNPQPI